MTIRKAPKVRSYTFSFDRPTGDNYRRLPRRLERAGVQVEATAHKTAYRLRRRVDRMDFGEFKNLLVDLVDDRLGTFLLTSMTTGNAWVMSNRGNRRGRLVRVES